MPCPVRTGGLGGELTRDPSQPTSRVSITSPLFGRGDLELVDDPQDARNVPATLQQRHLS